MAEVTINCDLNPPLENWNERINCRTIPMLISGVETLAEYLCDNPPSGMDEFIELTDTPASYAGSAGLSVVVNATEDGLEFADITPVDVWVDIVGDTMTGTLEIDVPTATSKALVLKTTDDNTTNSLFQAQTSGGLPFLSINADKKFNILDSATSGKIESYVLGGRPITIYYDTNGLLTGYITTPAVDATIARGIQFEAGDITGKNGIQDNWVTARFNGGGNKIYFGDDSITSFIQTGHKAVISNNVGGSNNVFAAPNVYLNSGNMTVNDPTTLGSEILTNGALTAGASWSVAGGFALTADTAVYTHSGGTGTLTQASGSFAVAPTGNRWYKLVYTISAVTAGCAGTITTGFASTSTRINLASGTNTVYILATSTPGNFVFSITSTAGGFTLDAISLKELQSGNINASGVFAGGGTSGIKVLANGDVGVGTVTPSAKLNISQTASSGTVVPSELITSAAHTALTASTERNEVHWNFSATQQFATGAIATQRSIRIQAPTYSFVGASTITTAVTLDISGAPIAGTNATINNPLAFRVSGNSRFDGTLIANSAVTFADGVNATFGGTSGNKLGTSITQKIGFWNATPVVQDTGWGSITNVTPDKAYDADTVTTPELADVVGTLIAQLVTYGILGA